MALLQSQALLHCGSKAELYNDKMTLGKRIKAARERLEPKPTQTDSARRRAAVQSALSDMQTNIRAPGTNQQRCVTKQVGTQLVTDCY